MADTQLAVIGAGPGGYAAAFHAADLGLKVTLVNDEERGLGGTCLIRGCIPSKALLHVARVVGEAREAAAWGVRYGAPKIELEALRAWKERVIGQLVGGLSELAKRRGVTVVRGRASFADSGTLEIEGAGRLRFERAILASGSVPAMPKLFALGDPRVLEDRKSTRLNSSH